MNVYIETYGCQMNKLDSEIVAAILGGEGFDVVTDMSRADVILLNTCGVRENAEMRIHGRIGELSGLKKERPKPVFGIIGCMAQRIGNELVSDVVRIVAGPDSYRKLPEIIQKALAEPSVDTVLDTSETYEDIEPLRTDAFSAWVSVMRGCNNFCTYCIVPYTRGRERSIPVDRIISDIDQLRQNGFREVTLLGQNVNNYQSDGIDFAGLMERVANTGIEWIRFLTSHPRNLTEELIEVMASYKNICNHLHLPLQAGSDRILSAMNRGYCVGDYISLTEKTRETVEGVSITTDLMFGFPGETEEDFRSTLAVMKKIRFDYAFLYRYSERDGTKAVTMPDSVPERTRIERLEEAIALQKVISNERNRERIGSRQVVLIKKESKDGKGWFGFTETNIPVVVTDNNRNKRIIEKGSFVNVEIESTTGASLIGKVIE